MKILFTGASSFSGAWFVRRLNEAGHQVTAVFRQPLDQYSGVRGERVRLLDGWCECIPGVEFGSPAFLTLARRGFDLLAHHAADVRNHRSPDFDLAGAVANNTHNLAATLDAYAAGGGRRVLLTGTFFEANEGLGEEPRRAFSLYGLSKTLTWEIFAYHAALRALRLGKFVMPNPFGPYDEPRFTDQLAQAWLTGGPVPEVRTPDYLRDNIHVALLSRAYADFVATLPATAGVSRLAPSGYVETQGAFALRYAQAMEQRWQRPCPLKILTQTAFPEPRQRYNPDRPPAADTFDEASAWDDLALYYKRLFAARG